MNIKCVNLRDYSVNFGWTNRSMTKTFSICVESVEGSLRMVTQWEATRLLFTTSGRACDLWGTLRRLKVSVIYEFVYDVVKCEGYRGIFWRKHWQAWQQVDIKMQICSNSDCASAWWSLPEGFIILLIAIWHLIGSSRWKQENTVTWNTEHAGIFMYDIAMSSYWDCYYLVYSAVWPFPWL